MLMHYSRVLSTHHAILFCFVLTFGLLASFQAASTDCQRVAKLRLERSAEQIGRRASTRTAFYTSSGGKTGSATKGKHKKPPMSLQQLLAKQPMHRSDHDLHCIALEVSGNFY